MIKVSETRCEYLINPIGIDVKKPRFNWILESNGRDIVQTAYSIQVAVDEQFENLVWNTGRIANGKSVHIKYGGKSLKPSQRYHYRISVEDNMGNHSTWSPGAFFETGLMLSGNWKAQFISPENETNPASSQGWFLKKSVKLKKPLVSARIYATALGIYKVQVNGNRVTDAELTPGWTNYKSRLLYQTYEATELFNEGENILKAHIGPGWYKGDLAGWAGKRAVYGGRNAFSMVLNLEYLDGSIETHITDNSWSSAPSPVLYSEIYNGEEYDARQETPEEKEWKGVDVIDTDMSIVSAQDGPLVTPQEILKPVNVLKDSSGRTILDFGQNMTGWIRFRVSGKEGEKVILKHAEILDSDGNLYTENLRSAKQTITYILKGEGEEEYYPNFTFQGFRYVLVEEFPGNPGVLDSEKFEAVVLHSEMEQTGTFKCSHPLINQLHKNIHWGMKGNFLDIPTDCPQRDERLGWTGDAQVFIGTASYLRNSAPFFTKWLRDLKSEQLPDGGIPHVIPDVLNDAVETDGLLKSSHSATGWADAGVICPWEIYRQYADTRILEENYGVMKAWAGYMERHAAGGTIWDSGFHFGDWVALDAKEGSYFGATPNAFTATVFYANSIDITEKTADLLGKKEDAENYRSLYVRIKKAFQEEFFTPAGRLAVSTQTAHALALYFNLTPESYKKRTVNNLVKLIEDEGNHLNTGFLGTPYLCEALSRNGRLDAAYRLLLQEDYPSWLYQVKQGATTIWEHWDGLKPDGSLWSPDMNSFNHYAYGSVGSWLYSAVAGISADEKAPGYKNIIFRPQPGGGITSASAALSTVYGKVSINWKLEGDTMQLSLEVPVNSTGELYLPGEELSIKLGSGNYEFSHGVPL